jgi:hypothetical protein
LRHFWFSCLLDSFKGHLARMVEVMSHRSAPVFSHMPHLFRYATQGTQKMMSPWRRLIQMTVNTFEGICPRWELISHSDRVRNLFPPPRIERIDNNLARFIQDWTGFLEPRSSQRNFLHFVVIFSLRIILFRPSASLWPDRCRRRNHSSIPIKIPSK